MVTVAPGSTPPVSSFTVPEIVPVSTWALTGAASSAVKVNANKPPLPKTGWMRMPPSLLTDRAPQRTVFHVRPIPYCAASLA